MAYNSFTIAELKKRFGIKIEERKDLFAGVPPATISDWLRHTLDLQLTLALNINTEKARSEMVIAPILVEVREQCGHRISLFSGTELNVDSEAGLVGVCDFLFSLSPLQMAVEAPLLVVVEAKNENIQRGTVQCAAEMVAAQLFNRQQENPLETVYGAVTTGSQWRFLRLDGDLVAIDEIEYSIVQLERIVGILLHMVCSA
jgi:hypothetical protein